VSDDRAIFCYVGLHEFERITVRDSRDRRTKVVQHMNCRITYMYVELFLNIFWSAWRHRSSKLATSGEPVERAHGVYFRIRDHAWFTYLKNLTAEL